MHKALIYLRVSTAEQAHEGVSLDAQFARTTAYCGAAGLQVMAVYREEGISASRPLEGRPEGQKVVERLRTGQATQLVAMKLDRLFRDAVDCLSVTREWDKAGIVLHLVDLGGTCVNTGSAMGRMFLTMAAGFAELERNLISERTSLAMQHLKSQGRHVGSPALGAKMVDGELVADEEELLAVRRVQELRRSRLTLREIAASLEEEGYPTKRGGQRWTPSVVRNILARAAE